jgi:hypothetical protein
MKLSLITKGTIDRPPRVVLAGVEKIGKSTFASQFPNPIFIPIKGEEGIDALDVARFPVAGCFAEVLACIETLAEEDHDFKTVVIDSVSTLEPLVWDYVCAESGVSSIEKVGGGFGKGYVEAVKSWREIMAALDYLRDEGMGCVLITHVAVKPFTDPLTESYDTYVIDIHKAAQSALLRWSDCILFANSRTIPNTHNAGAKETTTGIMRDERVLFTQKRPAHPGGGRGVYGQLPYELPFDYETWIKVYQIFHRATLLMMDAGV